MQNTSMFANPTYSLLPGYAIGYVDEGGYYINNHVKFEIEVYPVKDTGLRIVGF